MGGGRGRGNSSTPLERREFNFLVDFLVARKCSKARKPFQSFCQRRSQSTARNPSSSIAPLFQVKNLEKSAMLSAFSRFA